MAHLLYFLKVFVGKLLSVICEDCKIYSIHTHMCPIRIMFKFRVCVFFFFFFFVVVVVFFCFVLFGGDVFVLFCFVFAIFKTEGKDS